MMSRSVKSLMVSVFALAIFSAASIWVSNQKVNADTIANSTTISTPSPTASSKILTTAAEGVDIGTPPDCIEGLRTLEDGSTEDIESYNNRCGEILANTSADIATPTPNSASITQTRSKAPLHWAILITDAIIVLGLFIALTFRILGKILNPSVANNQSPAAIATTDNGQPKTIDDLHFDLQQSTVQRLLLCNIIPCVVRFSFGIVRVCLLLPIL